MGTGTSRSSVKALDPNKPPSVPGSGRKSLLSKPRSADQVASIGRRKKRAFDLRPNRGSSAATVTNVALRSSSATSGKSKDSGIASDFRSSPDASTLPGSHPDLHTEIFTKKNDTAAPRVDSEKIITSLRSEGLLGRPQTSTNKGGLCYEVPLGELQPAKKGPPARLQKLERQQELDLTRQRIREKLEKAEKRRKRREQEKIERSREKDATNLQVKLALLEIEKSKEKEILNGINTRLDYHSNRRASQVEQVVEKQKFHMQKVEETQKRKPSLPRNSDPDPVEAKFMQPLPPPPNMDDVPVAAARSKWAF